jgi:hypothetical protein
MANILTRDWLLSRRHALKGIGVSLALPFLECMRPLRAAEPKRRVKRSVFLYLPNGVNPADYQIVDSGKDYKLSRSLQSLERHRANITPISGLYHPNGLGKAHDCSNIWLTGAKHDANHRNTISIDQLMARVTEVQTRFSSLQLSSERRRSLSWTADGVSLPTESVPGVIFRRLYPRKASACSGAGCTAAAAFWTRSSKKPVGSTTGSAARIQTVWNSI